MAAGAMLCGAPHLPPWVGRFDSGRSLTPDTSGDRRNTVQNIVTLFVAIFGLMIAAGAHSAGAGGTPEVSQADHDSLDAMGIALLAPVAQPTGIDEASVWAGSYVYRGMPWFYAEPAMTMTVREVEPVIVADEDAEDELFTAAWGDPPAGREVAQWA